MLFWHNKMYVDEKMQKKVKKYKRLLQKNRRFPGVFCITLPVNKQNSMEIYSSQELWFDFYRRQELVVIGMAKSRRRAKKLVAEICLDVLAQENTVSAQAVHDFFDAKDVRGGR